MPKRVLVTGASGFVGAVLARRLVVEGHDVHLLVRHGSDTWRLDEIDAPLHTIDLPAGDDSKVEEAVRRVRPDWIFHLATHGAYSTQTDWRRMVETNVVGTMQLVKASLRVGFEAFIHAGSSSEYGFTDRAAKETDSPHPNSDYALTKASATLFCRHAAERSGAHLVTLRLYSVYGPYEAPHRLVPTLAVLGLEGKLPPLVSSDVARDFIFTEDVAEAFLLAAKRTDVPPGAVYNVGTGRQVTLADAVATVRKTLGIEVEPEWRSMPNRAWDARTWVANPGKIRDELGFSARVTFEEGFRRFVAWLQADPRRLAYYRERIAD